MTFSIAKRCVAQYSCQLTKKVFRDRQKWMIAHGSEDSVSKAQHRTALCYPLVSPTWKEETLFALVFPVAMASTLWKRPAPHRGWRNFPIRALKVTSFDFRFSPSAVDIVVGGVGMRTRSSIGIWRFRCPGHQSGEKSFSLDVPHVILCGFGQM